MKLNHVYRLIWISILLSLLASEAAAQLAVDRMLFSIPFDSRPAISVNVSNTDAKATLRVDVETLKMTNPIADADEGVSEGALVVSPMHFSIPPGESRAVRLLRRTPSIDREEVFRVNFNPSADDSDLSGQEVKKQKAIGLRVLFGVGLLIFSEPKEVLQKISWKVEDGKLTLSNSGNVNFVIDEIDICSPANECVRQKNVKRLYAGATLELPWDGIGQVKFRRTFSENSDRFIIDTPTGER